MLDVQKMFEHGLIEPARLLELFSRIEDMLYKYPAIDEKSFRQDVEQIVSETDDPK